MQCLQFFISILLTVIQSCMLICACNFASSKISLHHQNDILKRPFHEDMFSQTVQVNIDAGAQTSNFTHFWRSTGFSPPLPHHNADWFLGRDMTHNLLHIGAMPHTAIQQVRMHYLLDLITVERMTSGKPVYNFTSLDLLLVNLWSNGLKPGFELMGNPSLFFSDFENETQVILWSELVQNLAKRYIDQFGPAEIESWNFETWNEPRSKQDFGGINMTIQGFLNYYDACSEGLSRANPRLKLGGPGGECQEYDLGTSYCWNLLKHTQSGTNFFSGKTGTTIDFLSFHKKGEMPNNTATLLAKEEKTIRDLNSNIPSLSTAPIFNDEGDPLVTWSRALTWRADVTYAAMAIKIITAHQSKWLHKGSTVNFHLLSNDNGFLSYQPYVFSQRTLLARFQVNKTDPPHVQYIRKPIYTVLGLMALLGDVLVNADIRKRDQTDNLGALVTIHEPDSYSRHDSWQLTGIIYSSTDTNMGNLTSIIKLHFSNIPIQYDKDIYWTVYQLDNQKTNPYQIWKDAGKPPTPSKDLCQKMRTQEEPFRWFLPTLFKKELAENLTFELPLPAVLLFQLCAKPEEPPDQVSEVNVYNVTSGHVLIVWTDSCVHAKCLKTYEVEYKAENGQFKKINYQDIRFNLFNYSPLSFSKDLDSLVHGYYRVRAVDFWDRPGAYSLPTPYGLSS